MMAEYRHRFTPRYYEIDRQGVMFNMWYLGYVDTAVGGLFEQLGLRFQDWAGHGFDTQVVHAELDYAAGLTDDAESELILSVGRIGTKSFTLEFLFRTDLDAAQPIDAVSGRLVYAVIGSGPGGAIVIPDRLRAALES
ncbi:thioesterase family protein [Tsukamurella strandjordii]